MDRSVCPARDKTCRKCQKIGHHASVCMSSKSQAAETEEHEQEDTPSEASVSFSFGTIPPQPRDQSNFRLSNSPQHPRLSPSLSFIRPYFIRQDALAIIPSANVLSECIRND